jgi:death on curing protein
MSGGAPTEPAYLDTDDLLEIASIVLGDTPGVRDHGLLDSAAARPQTIVFGAEAYPDLATKAAALLHSICANHALIDGNKRLAWAAPIIFLALANDTDVPDVDVDRAEELMMAVASGRLNDLTEIAERLQRLWPNHETANPPVGP